MDSTLPQLEDSGERLLDSLMDARIRGCGFFFGC
jgi:hypothetical protein